MKKLPQIFLVVLLLFAFQPPPAIAAGFGKGVITVPERGTPFDKSGAITTGGSSQVLAAAFPSRVYFEFQNISDETMYINFGAAAVADSNSFRVSAGGSYVNPPQFCPNGTITVISATTGKKFIAKEYGH